MRLASKVICSYLVGRPDSKMTSSSFQSPYEGMKFGFSPCPNPQPPPTAPHGLSVGTLGVSVSTRGERVSVNSKTSVNSCDFINKSSPGMWSFCFSLSSCHSISFRYFLSVLFLPDHGPWAIKAGDSGLLSHPRWCFWWPHGLRPRNCNKSSNMGKNKSSKNLMQFLSPFSKSTAVL